MDGDCSIFVSAAGIYMGKVLTALFLVFGNASGKMACEMLSR
jgi:hypothetical protein